MACHALDFYLRIQFNTVVSKFCSDTMHHAFIQVYIQVVLYLDLVDDISPLFFSAPNSTFPRLTCALPSFQAKFSKACVERLGYRTSLN